ncbi:unnamed protein product [Auanema sp. JU1783]|nr:unnamed protein product [Auanema sp. JU1783]
MAHLPSVLSGRDINWCPDGRAYHPYCPGPADPDGYNYCCTHFYLGSSKPSCCRFPIHTGLFVSLIICSLPLAILFVFFYCWCWPSSHWNRRRLLRTAQ